MILLKNIIFEATRELKTLRAQNKDESRENIESTRYQEILKNGAEKLYPNFFIHFTNFESELTPFLGAKWNTPYGIYGYPISGDGIIHQAFNGNLPYGNAFKFIKFFRLKNYEKLLIMDQYSMEDYERDKKLILSWYNDDADLHQELSFKESEYSEYIEGTSNQYLNGDDPEIKNPAQMLVYALNNYFKYKNRDKFGEKETIIRRATGKITQNFTNYNLHTINLSKALNRLGYVGLCDLGNGFIGREYSQAVIFSSKYIEVIGEVKNPFIYGEMSMSTSRNNINKLTNIPNINYYKKIFENTIKNNNFQTKINDIKFDEYREIAGIKLFCSFEVDPEISKETYAKIIQKLLNARKQMDMFHNFLKELYKYSKVVNTVAYEYMQIINFDENTLNFELFFPFRYED